MRNICAEVLTALAALPCTVTVDGTPTENALPVAVLRPGTEQVSGQCDSCDYAFETRFAVAVYASDRAQALLLLNAADALLCAKGFRMTGRASQLAPEMVWCEEAVYRGVVIGDTVYQ